MIKKYAIVYLIERTWKIGMDVFSGTNESEVKRNFHEYYRHANYRRLSIVEIPKKEDCNAR